MFDLIVIGGGNALALAKRCANAGWNVAVIEADRLGGTCPNRGCIPSKLLLGHSEVATAIQEANRFHIDASISSIDREKIRREVFAATIDRVDSAIASSLPEKCTLFRGRGKFVGKKQLEVNGQILEAEKIVVAVGTRPITLDGHDGEDIWTSDDVFEMTEVPNSIAIVGGGYIACELAWFFSSMGVETSMHVRSETLLRKEDQDIRTDFAKGFAKHVDVRFNSSLEDAKACGAEKLLLALGRRPNTDSLNLEVAGVEVNDKGYVVTDYHQKTSAEDIFALGDVSGRYFFTHSAWWEALYLADRFLRGKTEQIDYGPMPHAVFSIPEVAGVGLTEQELIERGDAYHAVSLPFSSAPKGRAVKEEHGLCKFLLKADGEIMGCHIVGHQASVLIHEVLPVMRWRNNITSLTGIIHIHPALPEIIQNVALKAADELDLPTAGRG